MSNAPDIIGKRRLIGSLVKQRPEYMNRDTMWFAIKQEKVRLAAAKRKLHRHRKKGWKPGMTAAATQINKSRKRLDELSNEWLKRFSSPSR